VMSTPAYVDSVTITQADGAQSSRVPFLYLMTPMMTRMVVPTQLTLSLNMSARITDAAALFLSSFRKKYRSSYETSSSSLTLPVQKRYRGTSELILDTDSEGDELGDEDTEEDKEDESLDADDKREGHGLGDKYHGLDDKIQGLEDKGLDLKVDEAVLEGQQQAALVVEIAASL
nr:hypothetical protein [Tanacetum cinerariifolium]